MFPVENVIGQVRDALEKNKSVVLAAPPGSGKTTCVPPALLSSPFLAGKKIVMLEPRRLAARNSAEWIARRLGESAGGTVGYQVRLERKISPQTRLEIVTEGLLAQRIANDPELADTGLIIFDEFHERSVHCDLGFALALDVRRGLREDLRILVMSATLDADAVARHLGDAEVIHAQGRMYPVETRFLREEPAGSIDATMAGAVRRVLAEDRAGDILCFLPGEGEIRRTEERLRGEPGAEIVPLFGALPFAEQQRAFAPAPHGSRKVILATSIAETSLTIDGVTTVIDCGLMRVGRFSPASGMNRLETMRITRDRADQRRGRAGRTQNGVCLRLWTEAQDRLLAPHSKPEIEETDLAPVALACVSWGAANIDSLPWLTPPPAALWKQAMELLAMLGAVEGEPARLTRQGLQMMRSGAHPRLAAMMTKEPSRESAFLAALLEEAPSSIRRECDVREAADIVLRCKDAQSARVKELARRWHRGGGGDMDFDFAGEILALAFPDRIGRNRGNGTFQLSGGRGAWMEREQPLADAKYLVCCTLDDSAADAKIHLAAPIGEDAIEEIFAGLVEEKTSCVWDARLEQVAALRERRLGRMVIKSAPDANAAEDDVAKALCEGIRKKGVAALAWTKGARQLQERILFLHEAIGEPWPDVRDCTLEEAAEKFFGAFIGGMRTWRQLEKIDMHGVIAAAMAEAGASMRELDRLAPLKMSVPSGSEITIHYDAGEPYAAVRLQETFGMKDTPVIAGGRAKVVMHLLSPAQRPVQITKDLAGFWRNTYALVRKDLRGRYPKHYWPEDPLTAIATRRVKPRGA
ncbi:MAG: ATP-dependent helicase HrpB [Kiritimatiellae bacterium]|nr:ATP-dependent helicase HrpB [Kiritimatiellia bacterium]